MITDFYLEPVFGEFDVRAVEAFIEAMPFTARDTQPPATFMVAKDEDELEDALSARKLDGRSFPASVLLITVHPKRIDMSYRRTPREWTYVC